VPLVSIGTQFIDGNDPRVLELTANLGPLDETADHVWIAVMPLEQHLACQVAPRSASWLLNTVPIPSRPISHQIEYLPMRSTGLVGLGTEGKSGANAGRRPGFHCLAESGFILAGQGI